MIRIGFYTSTVNLSGNLPDISIFTDHDFVDFRLACYGSTLLEGRFYALNGTVLISEISSLVGSFMAGNADSNLCDFTIEAYFGDTATDYTSQQFTVLFCDREVGFSDPGDWLKENFLTLTPVRRLAPDSFINVSWYTTEKEGIAFRVYATFLNDKGVRDTYFYVLSGNGMIAHINGILTEYITMAEIREKIVATGRTGSLTLLSVTVRCGNRSATFFVDPALADIEPFYYLNCFGVPEHLSLQRVTTEKVKADRSIASLGKSSQFYDVQTSKSYEVESAPLTSGECLQVEQMLTSPSVRLPFGEYNPIYEMDFDALLPVLITDFTSELSDTDEKPNSVKFTWRYAGNGLKVRAPQTPGIFNDKFQPPFS